jgi:co-chaperonin GroES (HSP10)
VIQVDLESRPLSALEAAVDELTQELFRRNRAFVPLYPWVFVRVCKREQQRSGIWLSSAVQNKTVHEGIVMATWGERQTKHGLAATALSPGDHVLFHHFAGVPIEGYDRDRYRVVRELDWDPVNQGGIFATVEYDGVRPLAVMEELVKAAINDEYPERAFLHTVAEIDERFILVDKQRRSITLSGA